VLSGEAINTIFLVFGLTRPELEITIYCTRGEHSNHYATDAVVYGIDSFLMMQSLICIIYIVSFLNICQKVVRWKLFHHILQTKVLLTKEARVAQ
jgi:hypothetical protein